MATHQYMKDGSMLEDICSYVYDLSEGGVEVSIKFDANGWSVTEPWSEDDPSPTTTNLDNLEDVLDFLKDLSRRLELRHGPMGVS